MYKNNQKYNRKSLKKVKERIFQNKVNAMYILSEVTKRFRELGQGQVGKKQGTENGPTAPQEMRTFNGLEKNKHDEYYLLITTDKRVIKNQQDDKC